MPAYSLRMCAHNFQILLYSFNVRLATCNKKLLQLCFGKYLKPRVYLVKINSIHELLRFLYSMAASKPICEWSMSIFYFVHSDIV